MDEIPLLNKLSDLNCTEPPLRSPFWNRLSGQIITGNLQSRPGRKNRTNTPFKVLYMIALFMRYFKKREEVVIKDQIGFTQFAYLMGFTFNRSKRK